MPRKRHERATSDVRYRVKVFKWLGVPPPQDLVNELSIKMWTEREANSTEYKRVWNLVKQVLVNEGINKALYVPYKACSFEFYNKVFLKGSMRREEWFSKWEGAGLDPRVLTQIEEWILKVFGGGTTA